MTESTATAKQSDKPAKAKNTTHLCQCLTGTGKQCDTATDNWFGRGHDARMSSRLANEVATGKTKLDEAVKHMRKAGGSDLLVGKMTRAAERIAAPKTPKEPKADKAAAAKEAAAAKTTGKTVTVTHGKREYKAGIVTTAGGKMVARHELLGKQCDHDLEV